MSELILHHYPQSPFSEKVRLMLGFKGLSWRSVFIPPVMPKPDLTALTGGYRRTPVLQVGADIYCDSALIARRLEREEPTRPLFPAGSEAVAASAAQFADQVLFMHAVAINFQPHGLAERFAGAPEGAVKAFLADRQAFFSGGTARRVTPELALSQWPTLLGRLEQQLSASASGTFLMGEEPTIVDFAHYHPLWFISNNKAVADVLADYPQVRAWMDDLAICGHGEWTKLDAAEAIEIARAATPESLPETPFADPAGLPTGEAVTVSAVDYGTDPVAGTLVFQDAEEIVISREDERAGLVHVHFPRMGFLLKRQ